MSASPAANSSIATVTSSSKVNNPAFWERLWKTSGLQFVALFVLTYFIYGYQPGIGASPEALSAFYAGDRTRILVAALFSGLNVLNLMWFAAALRTTLADAGQDGWGAAATASSAAFAGLYLLQVSVGAALAFSIAGTGNPMLTSALNDFTWALLVLHSFPRAMLVMSAAFGLWRGGLISNALFAVGVAAVLLGVLGGCMCIGGGFWAPDGTYSRFVSPTIGLAWLVVVSWVLLTRSNASRAAW